MDKNIKTLVNLNLFGVIPVIFITVFVGIFLERCDFKNALLRNIFLGLLGLLGLLAIMMLYNHFAPAKESFSYEKEGFQSSPDPVATPTCG